MSRPKEILSWLPDDRRLDSFYEGIVKFVDEFVQTDGYKKYAYSKEVLDPCVGYIKINSWEMAILDTMLFQRLRKITQLGLANLVYPSLNYNRFEHTIGTLGRLNQVLTKLKENDIRIKEKVKRRKVDAHIIDKYEIAIRIAALFHDVGHCLFSHLSEFAIANLEGNEIYVNTETNKEEKYDEKKYKEGKQILSKDYYPSVKTIRDIFYNDDFCKKQENPKIFEIFSISILGTKKIANLLLENFLNSKGHKTVYQPHTFEGTKSLLSQSAHFIAGLPVENELETVFLAQLMSSGLDVDKLDYMSREELFSGIKIEMDLQRIFNKINIFEKSRNELAEPLKKYSNFIEHNDNDTRPYIVLGIDKGGQFAYEEFCIARLSLYEKIYLHKKVRAAESYMRKQIKTFIGFEKNYNRAHKWLYLPESIIETPSEFTKIVSSQGNLFNENTEFITKKEKLNLFFMDIFKRQIPDRTFGFGPSNSKTDTPLDEYKINDDTINKLQSVRLWEFLLSKEQEPIKKLENSIIDEAKQISEKIKTINNGNEEYDFLPKSEKDWQEIEKSLVLDVPKPDRVKLNPQTLHFEDIGAFNTVKWTIPIDNIHHSYLLHKILAYVYVNHRFVPLITLACERILYKYSIIEDKKEHFIYDQTQTISKENRDIIKTIKDKLVAVGFYDEYPELKPLHKSLTTSYAVELIEKVVKNLSYLECCPSPSKLDVEEFLKQFDEELQLSALHLISNIKILSPQKELPDVIKERRNDAKIKDKKVAVFPLGNYLNSSSNFYKHLKSTFIEQEITLLSFDDKDVLQKIEENEYIFLIDDNINSGIQCFNFMMRYLGYKKDDVSDKHLWLTKYDSKTECTVPSLEVSEKLRDKKFEFLFVTGHEKSDERLSSYLVDYCKLNRANFNIHIIKKIKDDDKVSDLGNIFYSQIDNKYTDFGEIKKNFRSSVTPEQIEKTINKFREIGEQLVKEKGICTECGQEQKDHALGYHNRENLVIFVNSIPTMTFTALWCEGKYTDENGVKQDWKPLIIRK
jgi:HD superfamily phosphohydrolase